MLLYAIVAFKALHAAPPSRLVPPILLSFANHCKFSSRVVPPILLIFANHCKFSNIRIVRSVLIVSDCYWTFQSHLSHSTFAVTFSVLQYLVGSAQLCLLRRCHSVYVSCQCFTDSVVSTPLSNFVPICWHLDIHVRVERIFLFAAYYWYRALKSKMLAFNFVTKTFSFNFVTKTLSFQLRHDFLQLF